MSTLSHTSLPTPLDKLLTPNRLAELLCLKVSTIRKLSSPGQYTPNALPEPIRIGGKLRWEPSVVRRWIDIKYGRVSDPEKTLKRRGRPRGSKNKAQEVR